MVSELVALWPPHPSSHLVTSIAVAGDNAAWTGAEDGAIVRWHLPAQDSPDAEERPQASSMLLGHVRPVMALVAPLEDALFSPVQHLLSIDASGVCCLWAVDTGRCVSRHQPVELSASALAADVQAIATPSAHLVAVSVRSAPQRSSLARRQGPTATVSAGGASSHASDTWGPLPTIALLDWRTIRVVRLLKPQPTLCVVPSQNSGSGGGSGGVGPGRGADALSCLQQPPRAAVTTAEPPPNAMVAVDVSGEFVVFGSTAGGAVYAALGSGRALQQPPPVGLSDSLLPSHHRPHRLQSAAFSSDGQLLLLATDAAWLLLSVKLLQDAGTHVPLDAAKRCAAEGHSSSGGLDVASVSWASVASGLLQHHPMLASPSWPLDRQPQQQAVSLRQGSASTLNGSTSHAVKTTRSVAFQDENPSAQGPGAAPAASASAVSEATLQAALGQSAAATAATSGVAATCDGAPPINPSWTTALTSIHGALLLTNSRQYSSTDTPPRDGPVPPAVFPLSPQLPMMSPSITPRVGPITSDGGVAIDPLFPITSAVGAPSGVLNTIEVLLWDADGHGQLVTVHCEGAAAATAAVATEASGGQHQTLTCEAVHGGLCSKPPGSGALCLHVCQRRDGRIVSAATFSSAIDPGDAGDSGGHLAGQRAALPSTSVGPHACPVQTHVCVNSLQQDAAPATRTSDASSRACGDAPGGNGSGWVLRALGAQGCWSDCWDLRDSANEACNSDGCSSSSSNSRSLWRVSSSRTDHDRDTATSAAPVVDPPSRTPEATASFSARPAKSSGPRANEALMDASEGTAEANGEDGCSAEASRQSSWRRPAWLHTRKRPRLSDDWTTTTSTSSAGGGGGATANAITTNTTSGGISASWTHHGAGGGADATASAAAAAAAVAADRVACASVVSTGGAGSEDGQLVLLHCLQSGDLRGYRLAAYAAPGTSHTSASSSALLQGSLQPHQPNRPQQQQPQQQLGQQRQQQQQQGQQATGGQLGGNGSAAVVSMPGHMAQVTCQVEVVYCPGLPQPTSSAFRPSQPFGASFSTPSSSGLSATSSCVQQQPPSLLQVHLLVTGAQDGGVRGWSMQGEQLGRPVFSVHPHTGPVTHVMCAPSGAHAHTASCLVSTSSDGSVAVTCLLTCSLLSVCRGCPFGAPLQVVWSARRGYLACGGLDGAGDLSLAVFDAESGLLDRTTTGDKAKAVLSTCCTQSPPQHHVPPAAAAVAAASRIPSGSGFSFLQRPVPDLSRPSLSLPSIAAANLNTNSGSVTTAGSSSAAQQQLLEVQPSRQQHQQFVRPGHVVRTDSDAQCRGCFAAVLPSTPQNVALVAFDVPQLVATAQQQQLQSQSQQTQHPSQHAHHHAQHHHPQQPHFQTTAASAGGDATPASLTSWLTAVACLHRWGLDRQVDDALSALLAQCRLVDAPATPGATAATATAAATAASTAPQSARVESSCSSITDAVYRTESARSRSASEGWRYGGGTCLVQDAVTANGATTIAAPYRLNGAVALRRRSPPQAPASSSSSPSPPASSSQTHAADAAAGGVSANEADGAVAAVASVSFSDPLRSPAAGAPPTQAPSATAAARLDGRSGNTTSKDRQRVVATNPGGLQPLGDLWRSCGTFVAQRLLALVSISRGLVKCASEFGSPSGGGGGRGVSSRLLNAACSGLWTFCLVQVHQLVAVGSVAAPDLEAFAALWLHPDATLREAAQLLLSAYTEPLPGPEAPHGCSADSVLPSQVLWLLEAWQAAGPRGLPAQYVARYCHKAIVSGAACLHHSSRVPLALMAVTAASLAEVVFVPPTAFDAVGASSSTSHNNTYSQSYSHGTATSHTGSFSGGKLSAAQLPSAVAAAMLTEALQGSSSGAWRQLIEPWDGFVSRLLCLAHALGSPGGGSPTERYPPPFHAHHPHLGAHAASHVASRTTSSELTSPSGSHHGSSSTAPTYRQDPLSRASSASRSSDALAVAAAAATAGGGGTGGTPGIHRQSSSRDKISSLDIVRPTTAAGQHLHHQPAPPGSGAGGGGSSCTCRLCDPAAAGSGTTAAAAAARHTSLEGDGVYVSSRLIGLSSDRWASSVDGPTTSSSSSSGVSSSRRVEPAALPRGSSGPAQLTEPSQHTGAFQTGSVGSPLAGHVGALYNAMADHLVPLLAAAAAVDMPAFLKALHDHVAGGGVVQALPSLALLSLSSLLQTWSGWQCLARHLRPLMAITMASLAAPDSRSTSSPSLQATMSFVASLCHAMPSASFHADTMQVAAGCPGVIAAPDHPHPSAALQSVDIYDMANGALTWQLPLQPGPDALRHEAPMPSEARSAAGGGGAAAAAAAPPSLTASLLRSVGVAAVTAVAFDASGARLAALCRGVPCVLVWSLRLPWSMKLLPIQRQALVVQPTECVVLHPAGLPPLPKPAPPPRQSSEDGQSLRVAVAAPSVTKAYTLRWYGDSAVEVLHNGAVVKRVRLEG